MDKSVNEKPKRSWFPFKARVRRKERNQVWILRRKVRHLKRQRKDLKRILGSLGEGVLAVDATGIVLYVNPVARDLLDIDPDTSVGSHLFVAVSNPDVAEAMEAVMRGESEVRSAGVQREFIIEKDGVELILLALVKPLRTEPPKKNPVPIEVAYEGAIVVIRDITELRRLEGARQEFFANVNHELKTPITAVKGAVETIIDDPQMEPEVRKKFLQSAHAHSTRLSTLVTDLLALSRLEHTPNALDKSEVIVSELVTQILARAEYKASTRGVKLELNIEDNIVVNGDEESLCQAIENLVDNAIAHTTSDGAVSISIKLDNDSALVSVLDTGEGIPTEMLERVFERFYRVDTARSRARGGTGIGLSIVKHVAQAHGGEVYVTSEVGKGSNFQIKLPVLRSVNNGKSDDV